MFKKMTLGKKLLIFFLVVGLVPFALLAGFSLHESKEALTTQAYSNLAAVGEYKTQVLERWLDERKKDVHAIPLTPFYVKSVEALLSGDSEAAAKARAEVLHEFKINQKLHGYFNEMKLLDLQGNPLVSLQGIEDFEGDKGWFKAAIANAGKTVKGGKCADLYCSGIEFCGELGKPSVHISHVIRDRDSFEPKAVFIVDCNIDQVMEIIQNRVGMGETGESYLVGPDKLMRSNSQFAGAPTIFKKKIETSGVEDVFAKREIKRGKGICQNVLYENYAGEKVLAHNHYIAGLDVALINEIGASEALSSVAQMELLTGTISVAALAAILALALFLTRSITSPIVKTAEMISEMEKGHLDRRLKLDGGCEIGQMARTMDRFADSLQEEVVDSLQKLAKGDLTYSVVPHDDRDVLRSTLKTLGEELNGVLSQVSSSSEQIATGGTQVADSSQSLSQGATEQASSLEEISSSMTQMASQTKLNAENAAQANQLSALARDTAEKGNTQMMEMIEAMGEINSSSQNISKIIKTIDEIAFQTNLLALNAAVEAARAGQHGKGFAVVAEEVRNLAARSAKAAAETADLIEGSVEKVGNGTQIADRTAEALDQIVTGVTKVTDLVSEIAAASNEQADGISEVTQGLNQIDQVTQQTTASAEESAAAAEELSSQATHLKQMMQHFTLKGGGQAAFTPPPAQTAEPNREVSWNFSGQPSDGWGGTDPSEVIALDDDEFGKY